MFAMLPALSTTYPKMLPAQSPLASRSTSERYGRKSGLSKGRLEPPSYSGERHIEVFRGFEGATDEWLCCYGVP